MRRAIFSTAGVMTVGALIPLVVTRLVDPNGFQGSSNSWLLAVTVSFFIVPLLTGISAAMQAPIGKALTVAASGALLGMVALLAVFAAQRFISNRAVATLALVVAQLLLVQLTVLLAVLGAWWARRRIVPTES